MRAEAVAREELAALDRAGLRRRLEPLASRQGPEVEIRGRRVANFCANDYLSLAGHPALARAMRDATERFGVGAGASRLIAGDTELHHALERRVAAFERTPAATLFNSGYAANLGILSTLAGPEDVVFSDALNHASLIDGCRLSRARVEVYPHTDVASLSRGLRAAHAARRRLVVTDAVFSMDGDLAPLVEIVELAEANGAIVVVDEAHGTGVFGRRGAGLCEHLGVEDRVDVRMGTLSKALGGLGGYAATGESAAELLKNCARSLVFSTALPAAVCAAGSAAIDLVEAEPALRNRLWCNVHRFAAGLTGLGLPASPRSPILPVVLGDSDLAMRAAQALLERGVFVRAIRPPTVPPGTSRLRFALSSGHTEEHVDRALLALGEVLGRRRRAIGVLDPALRPERPPRAAA